LSYPGQSGDASAGRRGVARRRLTTACASSQASQGDARQTPQASQGRTGGGMAGGGASPPPPSAHQLALPDEGVLLLVDQPPCAALSPRHALSRLHMALASGDLPTILRLKRALVPRRSLR